jgi:PIN domain nuclease of toxin-antitoxin system
VSRLLLDAHTVVWWDSDSPALGEKARSAIERASSVYVSAASEWELAIKAQLGKVTLRRTLLEAARDAGFELLAITFEHVQAVRRLKPIHKDPFDRLLVAVALTEELTLVSSNPILERYPIRVIEARV